MAKEVEIKARDSSHLPLLFDCNILVLAIDNCIILSKYAKKTEV
jgi:hypothetical protein